MSNYKRKRIIIVDNSNIVYVAEVINGKIKIKRKIE